ncbi:MAG: hypothetical protein WBF53_11195, partial [Litorimonas sp.]
MVIASRSISKVPFPPSANRLRIGNSDHGGAAPDGDAGLKLGGLAVEVAGHGLLTERLEAVRPSPARLRR